MSTWCNQDYALAEMWGGKLTRNETIAGGGNRCNYAFASADTPVKGGLTELREGGDSSLTSDPHRWIGGACRRQHSAGHRAGNPVIGVTINGTGSLKVRATRAGSDTTLSKIIKAVEEAQASKGPIERRANRVSTYFVPS